MWSEKYRPSTISDMVGNEESRAAIIEWFAKWRKGTKPLLLVGPPGTGKTTISYVAAKQFGYDLIGLNASDARSKSRINDILTPVLGNASVMGAPMIFIDEVDGIHGRSDYGGAAALTKILKEPIVPIVLAANDDTADKMKSIKKCTTVIHFKKIPPRLLRVYLNGILEKEDVEISPGTLINVINKSRGDIRSMINLAQTFVPGFNPQTDAPLEKIDVEAGINAFFKANSLEEARGVLYAMHINPRDKINAFYSSIITSSELDGKQLGRYLRVISDADILYGRIMKTQNWRLLRYLNDILIGLYNDGGNEKIHYAQYNISWPLLNKIRWDGAKLKAFSSALAERLHMSSSAVATFCLPCIMTCMKNGTMQLEQDDEERFGDVIRKGIKEMMT